MKHSPPSWRGLFQDINPVTLIMCSPLDLKVIFKSAVLRNGVHPSRWVQHWRSPTKKTSCCFTRMFSCHPSAAWFHSFAVSLLRPCNHAVISPPTHVAFKTKVHTDGLPLDKILWNREPRSTLYLFGESRYENIWAFRLNAGGDIILLTGLKPKTITASCYLNAITDAANFFWSVVSWLNCNQTANWA